MGRQGLDIGLEVGAADRPDGSCPVSSEMSDAQVFAPTNPKIRP